MTSYLLIDNSTKLMTLLAVITGDRQVAEESPVYRARRELSLDSPDFLEMIPCLSVIYEQRDFPDAFVPFIRLHYGIWIECGREGNKLLERAWKACGGDPPQTLLSPEVVSIPPGTPMNRMGDARSPQELCSTLIEFAPLMAAAAESLRTIFRLSKEGTVDQRVIAGLHSLGRLRPPLIRIREHLPDK